MGIRENNINYAERILIRALEELQKTQNSEAKVSIPKAVEIVSKVCMVTPETASGYVRVIMCGSKFLRNDRDSFFLKKG